MRGDITRAEAPCVLASLKEVLLKPSLTPRRAPGRMCAGYREGLRLELWEQTPEGQAGSESALGSGPKPRTGPSRGCLRSKLGGGFEQVPWVPGLSFPALQSRPGPMSLPGVWAVPGVGRGKGGSLVQPGPHGSLWEGCGTPSSDGPSYGFFFQGAHMGLALSCIPREQEIQTTGVSSPWKGWLASAWSVAYLKCPGLQAFLIQ